MSRVFFDLCLVIRFRGNEKERATESLCTALVVEEAIRSV
jgi:hypothetical protein